MNDYYVIEDLLKDPKWIDDALIIEFTFKSGLIKTVTIDTSGRTSSEIIALRQQILGKRKLIQSMFEHDTHGQITVQGLTVRADDLLAVYIK